MHCEEHHSELELAFKEEVEKFQAFAATTHTSYNWDYVSDNAVREILEDGGDISEHKHVKVARKKSADCGYRCSVSVTQSQPEPQTDRIQGTVVSLIRIPGSYGPGVPETRETNVKHADKTEGNLDVRGHRHIRRQPVSITGYLRTQVPCSRGRDRSGKEEEAAVVRLGPVPQVGVECGGGYGGLKVTS
ncbi:hypothetical protein L3X38_033815 [Prunus dulcis]|uniref:Uncharacterized protein n=1 Tax=Prunus dulcis TaxID=3755 RepID=A0AAD4YW96_PRUDU|nr:hypothetical protein L3X38_033815 [Prunus dulcis]